MPETEFLCFPRYFQADLLEAFWCGPRRETDRFIVLNHSKPRRGHLIKYNSAEVQLHLGLSQPTFDFFHLFPLCERRRRALPLVHKDRFHGDA